MDAPRSVCREPIPEQHHGTAQVPTHLAQEGHALDGRDVGVRMEAKTQMHARARGRHAQGRDDRQRVMGDGTGCGATESGSALEAPTSGGPVGPSARRFHPETPAKPSIVWVGSFTSRAGTRHF